MTMEKDVRHLVKLTPFQEGFLSDNAHMAKL